MTRRKERIAPPIVLRMRLDRRSRPHPQGSPGAVGAFTALLDVFTKDAGHQRLSVLRGTVGRAAVDSIPRECAFSLSCFVVLGAPFWWFQVSAPRVHSSFW